MAKRRPRQVIARYAAGRYRGLGSGTHGGLCGVQVVGPSGLYAEDVLQVNTMQRGVGSMRTRSMRTPRPE